MNSPKKYFFIFGVLILFYFICLDITTPPNSKIVPIKKSEEKIKEVIQPVIKTGFRYRKYDHVKRFYKRLALPVTTLCVKYKVPPGAVLSMLSLESGWGQGYIGKITGNFLSLNATRNDAELPALKMPRNKYTKKTIIDRRKLGKIPKIDIVWEERPSSLKKDYRPANIAGTTTQLDYFILHPNALTNANLENVRDFVTRFISKTSSIKAYREARELLDKQIALHGISVLFDAKLNEQFVKTIGGRPHSYNFRKTWPLKVMSIFRNVGANQLAKDLYINKTAFDNAW